MARNPKFQQHNTRRVAVKGKDLHRLRNGERGFGKAGPLRQAQGRLSTLVGMTSFLEFGAIGVGG